MFLFTPINPNLNPIKRQFGVIKTVRTNTQVVFQSVTHKLDPRFSFEVESSRHLCFNLGR